ncbi:Na+/H+ antiporter NhaA [Kocuria arenosa]|uniref:Na+/H+ antiporter NhaA n=1 Tax=Kocuria arenosa TaxID=3071446 RepID=UPI003F669E0E
MLLVATTVEGLLILALISVTVKTVNNAKPCSMDGCAIPTSANIAFAVSVLAMVSTALPVAKHRFVPALAVVDDLAAIVIIAFVYSDGVYLMLFLLALVPPGFIRSRPTGDTPTTPAASSEVSPWATCLQNSRSMLRQLDGAPGEISGDRPVNSFNYPAGLHINTLLIRVLHRPVESAHTVRCASPSIWRRRGWRRRSARSGTPTTTALWSRSSVCTRPSASAQTRS